MLAVNSSLEKIIPTLEGWCTVDKAKKLARVIMEKHPKQCVEIGVFAGRSLIAMALALRANNDGGIIHGIDPWCAPAALEGKNSKENEEWWRKIDYDYFYKYTLNKIKEHGVAKHTTVIREKSDVAVRRFDDASLDLVHIDGNHSEQSSTLDVNLWAPKLKSGGIMVMDDTNWATVNKALARLDELGFQLLEDNESWRMYVKK